MEKQPAFAWKAIAASGSVNAATADTMVRGQKCRFSRPTGCMEDHAATPCKAFRDLDLETKEMALADSRLCRFCLRHPIPLMQSVLAKGWRLSLRAKLPSARDDTLRSSMR